MNDFLAQESLDYFVAEANRVFYKCARNKTLCTISLSLSLISTLAVLGAYTIKNKKESDGQLS